MYFVDAVKLISDELLRAENLHPFWPKDNIHQAAIVGEEAGELLQATLDYKYFEGNKENIKKEAIHTAAMAIRLIMNLK